MNHLVSRLVLIGFRHDSEPPRGPSAPPAASPSRSDGLQDAAARAWGWGVRRATRIGVRLFYRPRPPV